MLIDERPEEVTDIKESIMGHNADVIYSTFDWKYWCKLLKLNPVYNLVRSNSVYSTDIKKSTKFFILVAHPDISSNIMQM